MMMMINILCRRSAIAVEICMRGAFMMVGACEDGVRLV